MYLKMETRGHIHHTPAHSQTCLDDGDNVHDRVGRSDVTMVLSELLVQHGVVSRTEPVHACTNECMTDVCHGQSVLQERCVTDV